MKTLLLAAALFATAAAGAVPKDAWKTATPSGKPVSCIQLQQIRESRVRDDNIIDFYMRDGSVYRNTLPNSCPSLGFEQRFSYQTSISQLCSVDIIYVLYLTPPRQGPACGLGQFQPVTGAGK